MREKIDEKKLNNLICGHSSVLTTFHSELLVQVRSVATVWFFGNFVDNGGPFPGTERKRVINNKIC